MTAPTARWKAVWPIVGPGLTMTTRDLILEAREFLPDVAARSRVALMTRPRFTRALGSDHPGSGGADEVLVAFAMVLPVPAHVDAREAQTTEPHLWGVAS